ncbi:Halomucin [Frankliniella fusca]|uniref:Halomucin n=1 Tax=Frankliniella fusca TaxID=407009 RepID=A0AAE1GSC7_9NEOP|nr:Halomucin [Frankliniella fusca]
MGVSCKCGALVRNNLSAVKNYLREGPHNAPFCCIQDDCRRRKFLVKTSYIRHLKEYHGVPEEGSESDSDGASDSEQAQSSSSASSSSSSSDSSSSIVSMDGSSYQNENIPSESDSDGDGDHEQEQDFNSKLEREAALLVLNLRRRGNVTGVAITAFAEESQKLIDAIVCATQEDIAKNLKAACVDEAVIENCVGNVPPPVLRNPLLCDLIHSEKKSSDGKIRSFLDGTAVKDNPLVEEYPHTIRLTLHADEFNPCNALGAKAGVHKTTEVNMQIQNLPPEENARLRSIFVLAYAYRQDLPKDTGIDPLLQPIITEMEELESRDGAVISLNGRPYVLRATIVTVAADDLEAHRMCGLLSPSAYRFCTHCLVSRPEMHQNIGAMGELRTKGLHSFHLEELVNQPKKFVARSYGLERKSSLLQVSNYSSFPQAAIKDGMHDILREIGPMEISLALHEFCHKRKLFTVQALNSTLQRFKYGPADSKNKPTPNFTEDSISNQGSYGLHQSAAQTWCLLWVFPFIMVSLSVPAGDFHLKMVVLLKEICVIMTHDI